VGQVRIWRSWAQGQGPVKCHSATPTLKWEHDFNCRESERIRLLRNITQTRRWEIPCVIHVPDYTLWMFNGLLYITKYTHSRVVGLRLEGSLIFSLNAKLIVDLLHTGGGGCQFWYRTTAAEFTTMLSQLDFRRTETKTWQDGKVPWRSWHGADSTRRRILHGRWFLQSSYVRHFSGFTNKTIVVTF